MRSQMGSSGRNPRVGTITALAGLSLLVTACGGASAAGTPAPATPGTTELHTLDEQAFVPTKDAWEIVDAFGSIWTSGFIGTMDDGTLSRIDPATNKVVASLHVSAGTDGIAASDDAIWIMDGEAWAIRAIDPATNELTDRKIPVPRRGRRPVPGRRPDLAHGLGHGELDRHHDRHGEVDADGRRLRQRLRDRRRRGRGVQGRSGAVYRLALDGKSIEASNIVDAKGSAIGVGPDAVYVGSPTGGVAILDPKTLELRTVVQPDVAVTDTGAKWSLGNPDRGIDHRRRDGRLDPLLPRHPGPARRRHEHDRPLRHAARGGRRREPVPRLGRLAVGHERGRRLRAAPTAASPASTASPSRPPRL